jgi:hypothetical protein
MKIKAGQQETMPAKGLPENFSLRTCPETPKNYHLDRRWRFCHRSGENRFSTANLDPTKVFVLAVACS